MKIPISLCKSSLKDQKSIHQTSLSYNSLCCLRFSSTILHCYRLWCYAGLHCYQPIMWVYNTELSSLLWLAWKVTLARHRIWSEKLKDIFTSFMHFCNTGSCDNNGAYWEEMEHYGPLRKRKDSKDNWLEVRLAQKRCLPFLFHMLCNAKKKL